MTNTYAAEILCDSLSPDGVRLTTFQVTFPRFILAEVNTHRVLSRNSASSRAIPTEKIIERVEKDPFVPETFNERVKGMGVGEALDEQKQSLSRDDWLGARDQAVRYARRIMDHGVDKSRVNRLLEPFMWHTAIITATEWANFFALRDHPAAQPEFQIIAKMMRELMESQGPMVINEGEWHLPLVSTDFPWDASDGPVDWVYWAKVSAGRCARVSFDTHENYEEPDVSVDRAKRLMKSGHLSPFEHCARPLQWNDIPYAAADHTTEDDWCGNFRGWMQYRKFVTHEDNFGKIIKDQAIS